MAREIADGTVHQVPADLRGALTSDKAALAKWKDITPLARNEWICWVISVKKPETRREHVGRVCAELKEGMRRPCCWIGCIHRDDKPISPSVQWVLSRRSKNRSYSPRETKRPTPSGSSASPQPRRWPRRQPLSLLRSEEARFQTPTPAWHSLLRRPGSST